MTDDQLHSHSAWWSDTRGNTDFEADIAGLRRDGIPFGLTRFVLKDGREPALLSYLHTRSEKPAYGGGADCYRIESNCVHSPDELAEAVGKLYAPPPSLAIPDGM